MFAFLCLLMIIILVFVPSTPSVSTKPLEGFETVKEIKPASLPGKLPVAPYQQIASTSPLPYQDTSLVKANRQQLILFMELLKGFLAFEADQISERSDPAIQLPLSTARSDFQILQSQIQVLNRNPGIQTTVTLSQLNEMSSNLAYLQQQVRLIGNAGKLQGPVYEFFENPSTVTATLEDLNELKSRLIGEIVRLSASGTTDPVIQARVGALTKMKNDVEGIIEQVKSGVIKPIEIPIQKKEIDRAFAALGKPGEPLPELIQWLQLPVGIANLLPSNIQKDPIVSREIANLIHKYSDKIINSISATFSLSYQPNGKTVSETRLTDLDQHQMNPSKFINYLAILLHLK
jgi:hypothetical protein